MSESDAGGGSTETQQTQEPDYSALLDKVSAIIDQKLEPVQEIVNESKNKSQRRNEELASQLKAEREKREGLETQLKNAGVADGGTVDDHVKLLTAQMGKLREDYDANLASGQEGASELKALKSELRRKELDELVLGGVATGDREVVRDMMSGYFQNNGIDPDTHQDLPALAKTVRERFLPRLSIQQADERTATSVQTQPGAPVDLSKVVWDDYKSFIDVPKNLRTSIPPEVFKRMETPSYGGTQGGVKGLGV